MIYFHSTFYFVRYIILLKCWKQVLFGGQFTLKLFFFSLLFTVVFFLQQIVNILFRTIDEVVFFNYRRFKIKPPVFIFANPRSGTTYLHQLMANDERFVYMKLAHTIFPSVSFAKLYKLVRLIDGKTGNLIKKIIKKSEVYLFGGWDKIHPLSFNTAEEDEAIYTLALTSPAFFLFFPFLHLIKDNWILDHEDEKVKLCMMNYYENCIKRFMYANGKDKIYLSKNVMSSGRINSLMKRFPDAKVIYIVRNPYESLPSIISMFGIMYKHLNSKIKNDDVEMQAWAMLGIAFYKHMNEAIKNIDENNFCSLKYENLVLNPTITVEKIYEKLNLGLSDIMKCKLAELELQNRNYKSKHQYSLEQFGLSKVYIYKELKFIFDQYGFSE